MVMQFKYFATNKIPVDSGEAVKKYLGLCLFYFHTSVEPYYTTPPKYTREINEDAKKIAEAYEAPSKLSDRFEITQLQHIGFLVKIGYCKKENSFKLRMFYEKSLEERNLDILFEPIMTKLASGPKHIGLNVHRIREELGEIGHTISYEEVKEHISNARIKYLLNEIKDANECLNTLDKEIDRAENEGSSDYHSLLEEQRYQMDSKKRHENEIRRIFMMNHYLGKYANSKETLRQKTEVFRKVRKRFCDKIPGYKEDMEGIAFGTFPYLHNEATQPHFGQLINLEGLLPLDQDFSFLGGRSLIEAEIFERPVKGLEWAVSLFPYTSHVPLFNDLTENMLKEEEMVTAMVAHELGERIAVGMFGFPKINILATMTDPFHVRLAREEEKKAQERAHEYIDQLLEELGYGEANNKLKGRYLKARKELEAICNQCGKNYLLLSESRAFLSDEQWGMHFNECFNECENNPFRIREI